MAAIEILTHKDTLHKDSISKLNYYVIGLILGVFFLIIKIHTGLQIPKDLKSGLVIIWALGSIAFLSGLIWLYILTEFFAADAEAVKKYESFKDILKTHGQGIPIRLSILQPFLDKDPDLDASLKEFQKADAKRRGLWPSSYGQQWKVRLLFDFYRVSVVLFISIFLIYGGIYISRDPIPIKSINNDSELLEKVKFPEQSDVNLSLHSLNRQLNAFEQRVPHNIQNGDFEK